jgi:hypothetical protein
MAHDINVRTGAMDVGVDDEAGSVNLALGALDVLAVLIDSDEVRDAHHPKVLCVRIDPECLWLNWVCEGNPH